MNLSQYLCSTQTKLKKCFIQAILLGMLIMLIAVTTLSFASTHSLLNQAKERQQGSQLHLINIDQAIQLLQQAGDQGDADALFRLAEYYSGHIVYRYLPENKSKYTQLRLAAAAKGHFEAYASLQMEQAFLQDLGIWTDLQDEIKKTHPNILKLAKQGDVRAMRTMSLVLENPNEQNLNIEQCRWLYQAVQKGDVLKSGHDLKKCDDAILKKLGAKSQDAYEKDDEQNQQRYLSTLLAQAKTGDIRAVFELKELSEVEQYLSDYQRKKIDQQIEQHYMSQAKKGASDAYLKLAMFKNDDKQKQALYEKAADLNHRVALTLRGVEYLWPDNKKLRNSAKGLAYLQKAAALKDADALNYLALWYGDEENDLYDEDKAQAYYLKAAQLGSVDAMNNLAIVLDEPENFSWAVKAYEQGLLDEDTLPLALEAYKTGKGAAKNNVKAQKLSRYLLSREKLNSNLEQLIQ